MAEQTPHSQSSEPQRRGIRDEADRQVDAYGHLHDLLLLVPQDRWEEFLRAVGEDAAPEGDDLRYRGALFRKAEVEAVTPQQGF